RIAGHQRARPRPDQRARSHRGHPPEGRRTGHGHPPRGRHARHFRRGHHHRGSAQIHVITPMPKFNYVAMDSRGKKTKGTLDVASQNEAVSRLKEMGYFPTKVTEADKAKDKPDKKAKAAPEAKGKKKGGINLNIRIPGLGGKVKPKVLT